MEALLVALVAVPFLVTVGLAVRGWWWASALPGAIAAGGATLYLANAGQMDLAGGKLVGMMMAVAGVPWLLIVVVVTLAARAYRRDGEASAPTA